MTKHRLLQRRRPSGGRRKRPGFFRVERPDQLWHMDMTPIWTAEHGWGLQVRCDPFRRGWCSLGRQAASARSRSVRRARQMLVHVGVGRLLDASDLLIAVPRGQPRQVPALAVRQRGQRAQRPRRLQRILELVGRSREGGWLLVELGELVARRCGAGRVRAPTRERARHAASCDRVTCRHTNCLETPSSRVYADDNTAS